MPEQIVLVHGFPFDASMWQHQADALRAAGHHVHTPNLPGFGDSAAWPRERCSIDAFAAEIHALITRDCAGAAVVGGLSMGGYVAQALAREHPEDLRALMLINTRADADTPEARANRLKTIVDVEASGNTDTVVAGMLGRVLGKNPSAEAHAEAEAIMRRQPPAAVIGAQHAMSRRRDQSDLLPTLKMPVLIIAGADDQIAPPSVALAMHNHVPGSMLVQVAHAGHLTPIEQPESVTAAITTFLATLQKRGH